MNYIFIIYYIYYIFIQLYLDYIEVDNQTQWIPGYVCLNLQAEKMDKG